MFFTEVVIIIHLKKIIQLQMSAFSPHPCTPPQPVWVSYGYVVTAIMKIHSTRGRIKAFNTCACHLTTVILFYGSGLFSYLHSSAGYAWDQDKMVPMLYGAVIPMLNPIIYSLRNKEIKDAVKKLKERKKQMSFLCHLVP